MHFREPELSILYTLAYTDQFDYPLTEPELWQRLISLDNTPINRPAFKKALLKLALEKEVEYVGQFLTLKGRSEIVKMRAQRAKVADQKSAEIEVIKKVVTKIPGVIGVFVTGSLAMSNAEADDDIDLLIITQEHRLWLARAALLWVSWRMGKKKSRTDEGKHGWCLNLWLDEKHLAVEPAKRNLYRAYEVIQAWPVYGAQDIISDFYKKNEWVSEYLPYFEQSFPDTVSPIQKKRSAYSKLLDLCDAASYVAQMMYMNSHRTTERVGKGFAFFHPRPTDTLVEKGWLHSLSRLKNAAELGTIASQHARKLFAPNAHKTP